VSDAEMAKVFNLGIGMVVIVPADDVFRALDVLRSRGHRAVEIGEVVPGRGAVDLVD
jgi:phosphoribosylformylglycinamidine cyclo-ligase